MVVPYHSLKLLRYCTTFNGMTSFPYQLRRMVQQYEAACSRIHGELKCGCDRTRATGSLPCDRCPQTERFEQRVRDRLSDLATKK